MTGKEALEKASYWQEAEVLLDTGHHGYSIVSGVYRDGDQCVGWRWNHDEGELGFPQSRGVPTFFVIPEEFAVSILTRAAQFDSKVVNKISLFETLKQMI